MDLGSSRLRLRDFRAGDLDGVHAYSGDPEVVRYLEFGPGTRDDAADFVRSAVEASREASRRRFALALVRREGDVVMGSVELRVTSVAHRRGELGYVLARRYWGYGFASEAAAIMVQFGFSELGLHKVTATCDPENAASAVCSRRSGCSTKASCARTWSVA